MQDTNSSHIHPVRNLDPLKQSKSSDSSGKTADLSTVDMSTNHRSFDSKKHKDKLHCKPKNILERIFSHKSKRRKEFCTAKAIAQSTLDIFAQSPNIHNDNLMNYTLVTTSISTGNLLQDESTQAPQTDENICSNLDHCENKNKNVPLASIESLNTNNSSPDSNQFPNIPSIYQEPASTRNSPLLTEYSTTEDFSHLTLPNDNRSQKSSDNDSAVDLKFTDYSSDMDRTNISETGSSRCPSTSLFVGEEYPVETNADNSKPIIAKAINAIKRTDSGSSWRKLKAALIWTPFIQQCARHRYPWIQIAGHQGNFKPGEQGTILKKYTGRESICLQMMTEDFLSDFVPQFKCDVSFEGEKYICMQDLLATFNQPSLIDIKMGTRTYLEEELIKARHCPKPRQDMYEKMIEIDENEPTEDEHKLKAILKPRYMQWRETLSSTITLGFRIEGVKISHLSKNKVVGTQSRDYKRTKDRNEVKQILIDFIDSNPEILEKFIERLTNLRITLDKSNFFWDHEFIGSSLLFVHDKNGNANAWMIDFGKTIPLPPNCKIDHFSPWIEGNHEDGYLFGLEQLLNILLEIHRDFSIEAN